MKENGLIKGYSPQETERIRAHLKRLLPHLESERFVIVGGLAIRHGLISRGVSYPKRPFNDLDLIAESEDVIHASITKDFLVYHHHPEFYFALVDPVSKTKIDIFNWEKTPFSLEEIDFNGEALRISSLENQLTVTVMDILMSSDQIKRDPKMLKDMELMISVSDLKKAEEIWAKRGENISFQEALEKARKLFIEHPEFFKEKPWHKPGPYKCPDCIETKDFPLTPMQEIYDILGYIE